MKTEYDFLQGKTKWFRPNTPDQYGKWAHVLYLDPPSVEKVRKLQESSDKVQGIKTELKKDDDGYYLTIGRRTEIKTKAGTVKLTPPEVFDGKHQLPDGSYLPYRGNVGNGSDVTTKIEIYTYRIPTSQTGKVGKAIRWVSSRIDTLVPYEGRNDYTEDEQKKMAGLEDQPKQLF